MRALASISQALVLVVLAVVPGQAQGPVTTAELESFRDSLSSITDPSHIAALGRAPGLPSSDPITTLRIGLTLLRRAELGDAGLFARARSAFREVGERHPAWPYPVFGIGLAERGRARSMASNPAELGNRVGYGSYQAAARAFVQALENDGSFEAAGMMLAQVASERRDTAMAGDALAALRPLIRSESLGTALLMAGGRLERLAGNDSAALSLFLRARDRPGAAELASLEAARTMLALGHAAGDSLYYAIAATSDSGLIAEYRSDLAPIAEEADLELFDGLSGQDRVAWLHRFWLVRDYADLRAPGKRLQEHYRRLYYAHRHFALQVNRRFFTRVDMFKDLNPGLDDRGVVYIRQGEPDLRIRPPMFALNPNETWVYRRPDGDLLLHFGAGGFADQGAAVDDYRLVHSIADLHRPGAHTDLLLLSRVPASPLYNRMLAWGPYGRARAFTEERELVEESALTGVTTDDFQLRYRHQLHAAAQLLVTGRPDSALLHLVFAIDDSVSGPIRIRLRLFDHSMQPLAAIDTAIPGSRLGHVTWPVSAGTRFSRFAIEQGEAGLVFPTDSVRLSPSDGLGVSDVLLAAPGRAIAWQPAPGDSAWLSPYREFPRDRSVEVYYEVYGVPPGAPYHSSIVVLDRGRSERTRVELTFSEQSAGHINRLRRSVKFEGLKRGNYWLEVRIQSRTTDRRVRTPFQIE